MLFQVVSMLKKRLGIEAIERDWNLHYYLSNHYFKIPSTLIISESCEKIGKFAFYECDRLKEVVISGSVKKINVDAFYNCTSLRQVVISRSVERIGISAFYNCEKAVIILEKAKKEFEYIGSEAFRGCRDVKEEVGT